MSVKRSKISRELERKREHLKRVSSKRKSKQEERQLSPTFVRPKPFKKEKESFLIICEGENTEPDYFNFFKLKSAKIKVIGEGYNTISLVKRSVEIVEEERLNGRVYDQIWCVFDKDDFDEKQFNDAITLAEKTHNFHVAYSNQSFEYWLVLHFNDHQGGAINRKDYDKMLNFYLKKIDLHYDGTGDKKISEDFFEVLQLKENANSKKTRLQKATERAAKIYSRLDHKNPAREESSTKVFLLVKEIIDNI